MRWAGIGAVVGLTVVLGLRIDWDVPSTLWLDDAWLALSTRADDLGELAMTGLTAPGYAALLRGVHAVTGSVEGLVDVAAVAALALPAAVAIVARRAFRLGWGPMVLAAGVVVACPLLATYAWRVKPYTVDALLAAVVLGLAARVLDRPADRGRWATFGIASLAALAMSAATAMTSAGCAVVLLFVARQHLRHLVPVVVPVAVAALAWWAAIVRPASTDALRDYWSDQLTITTAFEAARSLLPFDGVGPMVLLAVSAVGVALARDRRGLLPGAVLVVAALAGAAGLAPLGGGRTDLHLLPSAALFVAIAVDQAPAFTGWVVGLALALLAPTVEPYPTEDVGPLVAVVERDAALDDRILVYSAARWAYALETAAGIDIDRDRGSANGFDVVPSDARVTVLDPGGETPIDGDADDVWLLVSHGGDDVAGIRADIAGAGYSLADTWTRSGADLTRWHREGAP